MGQCLAADLVWIVDRVVFADLVVPADLSVLMLKLNRILLLQYLCSLPRGLQLDRRALDCGRRRYEKAKIKCWVMYRKDPN